MRYGFIGLGNMAAAILQGMHKSGRFQEDTIYGFDTIHEKALVQQSACNLLPAESLEEITRKSDVIVLAVKPHTLSSVLPCIKPHASGDKLFITIAAGKALDFYENELGLGIPVVRVMPNINAKVCSATSAICTNGFAAAEHKKIAVSMFETVGSVIEIDEKLFPAFSAISGASVAFVYLFIDALASAGVKAGMAKSLALKVAADTVLGSALLVSQSGEHPHALIDQVCSPAGTTIEGMHILQRLGFESTVHQAVDAVIQKDAKISNG